MACPIRASAAASVLLFAASCTTTTEITLPALEARETTMADALVVQSDYSRGFQAPSGVVRGAGEGAAKGVGGFLRGTPSGEAGLLWLLLAPIGIPVSAGIGASMAHSEEEVDAAVAAFNSIGQDKEFLASIDRRFLEALDEDTARQWDCLAAASAAQGQPCAGSASVARLTLRPVFGLETEGEFDPDIEFLGDVVVVARVDHAAPGVETDAVLEGKWAYREELGKFFALAQDDGALLRRKLDDILDRFAARIARDLYLEPRPQDIVRKQKFTGQRFTELPHVVVVRVAQGFDLPSLATHGTVRPISYPKGLVGRECWIDAIDGEKTGHDRGTAWADREVAVRAGPARLDVFCVSHLGSVDEKLHHYALEVSVKPGATYRTDGRTSWRIQH